MKTPTHFLIGYGCASALGWTGSLRRACLVGAIVPDLPVAGVWTVLAASVTWRKGAYVQSLFQAEMDALYFSHSLMIGLHNLLHSPVSLSMLTLLVLVALHRAEAARRCCLAFLLGAVTHALADILSHVTDGPLLLWPLGNNWRLAGPFSHWDPAYGGYWVTAIELLFVAAFALRTGFRVWRRRWLLGGGLARAKPQV